MSVEVFVSTARHRWRRRMVNEKHSAAWFPGGFTGTGYILEQAWISQATGEVQWRPIEVVDK